MNVVEITMINLPSNPQLLKLAQRYVWWESTNWALNHPTVFLANVMNLGVWEDWLIIRKILNPNILREVLREAPPGYFHYRSTVI